MVRCQISHRTTLYPKDKVIMSHTFWWYNILYRITYYLPSITSMSMVLMPFPWIRSTSLSGFNFRLSTLWRDKEATLVIVAYSKYASKRSTTTSGYFYNLIPHVRPTKYCRKHNSTYAFIP